MTTGEWMFWGGITGITVTAAIAVLLFFWFRYRKQCLQKEIDRKYGQYKQGRG